MKSKKPKSTPAKDSPRNVKKNAIALSLDDLSTLIDECRDTPEMDYKLDVIIRDTVNRINEVKKEYK